MTEKRTPEVRLHDGGKHILWSHECDHEGLDGSRWLADTMLPAVMDPPPGRRWAWIVEQVEPLTVSPSILCRSCGEHGFWRDGRWVDRLLLSVLRGDYLARATRGTPTPSSRTTTGSTPAQ